MATQIPNISTIPQFGQRGVQTRDEFVNSQETAQDHLSDVFSDEINNSIDALNIVSGEVETNAANAQISEDNAKNYSDIAQSSANYKGDWVAGYNTTGYSLGMSVTYTDSFNYVSKINNNLAEPTGGSDANWNKTSFSVQSDTAPTLGGSLDSNNHIIMMSKGSDIVSSANLTIGIDGNYFNVTGTTTVTSIDTTGVIGTTIKLSFSDSLILTHNATSLILPSGSNITTSSGDVAEFVEYDTGLWKCTSFLKANGEPIVSSGVWKIISQTSMVGLVTADVTIPSGYSLIKLIIQDLGTADNGGNFTPRLRMKTSGSYKTTNTYQFNYKRQSASGTFGDVSGTSQTSITFTQGNIITASGEITISDFNTETKPNITFDTYSNENLGWRYLGIAEETTGNSAVEGIRIFESSGFTFNSGKIILIGVE